MGVEVLETAPAEAAHAEATQAEGAGGFGVFSGDPRTVWLTEGDDDRRMKLIDPFSFRDAAGKVWDAPAGWVVDGASIPRALWTLVGSPYTGDYRRASIVHDVACDRHPHDGPDRRAGDTMFYAACRAGGCSAVQAKLLYLGVRIGSTWAGQEALPGGDDKVRLRPSPEDRLLQEEFARLGDQVVAAEVASLGAERLLDPQEEAARAVAEVDAIVAANTAGLAAPGS
ncbi:DUF1353 domain-containing protein [Caulobacter hibisci]|nr:DUF1353 domain-containing protein [Caulobacter hibisci]